MNVDYEKLAKIRKRKRITQKQLAEKINMSVSSIKAYETGRLSPSVSALEDICSVLGISASSVSDIPSVSVVSLHDTVAIVKDARMSKEYDLLKRFIEVDIVFSKVLTTMFNHLYG